MECDDGRSPDRRQTFNTQAIVNRGKMLLPHLRAGIEERNPYTALWIDRIDLGALVAIAEWAGKPEVRLIIAATLGERDDMLDLKASYHEVLRAEAIATAVAGGAANAEFNIGRDVSALHASTQRRLQTTVDRDLQRLCFAHHTTAIDTHERIKLAALINCQRAFALTCQKIAQMCYLSLPRLGC